MTDEENKSNKDDADIRENIHWPKVVYDTIRELNTTIKHYFTVKHKHDNTGLLIHLWIVLIIAGIITALGFGGVLGGETIGTLLGSLIGYSMGRITNNTTNKKQ